MIDNEFSPSAIQATTFLTDVVLVDVVNFTRLSDEDQLVTGMMINDGILLSLYYYSCRVFGIWLEKQTPIA